MGINKNSNASHSEAYVTLSTLFDFDNNEQRLWWHSTAPMFAEMLQAANYDIHSQYKYLGVYKKYVIPFLGVYPTNDRDRWLSILTRYGTPFELSLNCSDSLVRYTFESINEATGTARDPFNTHAIWDSLKKLVPLQNSVDLEWFKHFKTDLTLNEEESAFLLENKLAAGPINTQNKLSLDLKNGGFMLKTYIYPALKSMATGQPIWDLIYNSVHQLSRKHTGLAAPLSTLNEYVQSRKPEGTVEPRLLSCDLVDPSKSRVKIYLLEKMVSLSAMEDLWTMGGRRKDDSTLAGLSMIRELWELIKLQPGLRSYPEPYLPLGTIPNERLPLMANYTLHQDNPIPEAQVYFTPFGMNDAEIADALTTFFKRRGWTDMAQTYKDTLRAYYPHANHDNLNYLHAYISFSYRNEKPYLSVYLQSFETGDWVISNFGNPESKCKSDQSVFVSQKPGRTGRVPPSHY